VPRGANRQPSLLLARTGKRLCSVQYGLALAVVSSDTALLCRVSIRCSYIF
jgi:hypothetical protein